MTATFAEVLDARTTEPDVSFQLGQLPALLDVPYHSAMKNAGHNWSDYLNPAVRANGSGTRARYTARDVVVMRLMVDLVDGPGSGVNGTLRDQLARTLAAVPWGTDRITATAGRLALTYRPRWLNDDEIGPGR